MSKANGNSNGHNIKLRYDPKNARKHSERNRKLIRQSLETVGAFRSIGAVRGEIKVGNGVAKEAESLGFKFKRVKAKRDELVVVERDDMTDAEATRAAMLDNLAADSSAFDYDAEILASIAASDDLIAEIASEEKQLSALLAQANAKEETADAGELIDKAAELQKKWQVRRGDVWEIESQTARGKCHRLMCGDSTNSDDVAKLMGNDRAQLMNTDPPYGVDYANDERPNPGVAKPRVANDSMTNEETQAFLEKAFTQAIRFALTKNAAWYLWHPMLLQGYFAAAAAAAAVIIHRQIIWVKDNMLLTRGMYHWKHELCFMGWVQGNRPPDYGRGNGERDQVTVWEIKSVSQKERKEFNHSTPKPVGLFTIPMIKHLRVGEIAYEPFSGSAPQFVAGEQTGRLVYGLELEPKYCAVALERLSLLGLEPRRVASARMYSSAHTKAVGNGKRA